MMRHLLLTSSAWERTGTTSKSAAAGHSCILHGSIRNLCSTGSCSVPFECAQLISCNFFGFLERHSKNGQNQTLLVQLIRQKERSPETNECGDNSVAGPRWLTSENKGGRYE